MLQPRQNTLKSTPWGSLSWVAEPGLFAIDSNGNLTQKTEGSDTWGYEWNALNQLTRVTKNTIEQARFGYDPLGRRVEKIAAGVTTSYTYDRADILREFRGALTLMCIHGPAVDEPLACEDSGGALKYYQADALGSIVKRTNHAGAVVHEYRYDAWGNIEVGVAEPGYAFTGREWDPEIGLYYYRARLYDPKGGRFVSEDPVQFLGGNNFYSYVDSRPATWTDPKGLAGVADFYRMWHWMKYPPRNPWDFWEEARDRTRNRTKEDEAKDPSNRTTHCIINCRLVGESWPVIGPGLSAASDYIVFTGPPFPYFTLENHPDDAPGDRQANEMGRCAARQGRNCIEFCESVYLSK